MTSVQVKIKNLSKHKLPIQAMEGDAGFDLRADIDKNIKIKKGNRKLISTGLYMELPRGYEIQIRPRSGLAIKSGITILNSPGTIDSDYRGEIKIIVINHSNKKFIIEDGMRIAQMVVQKVPTVSFLEVDELSDTERGKKGFGESGLK